MTDIVLSAYVGLRVVRGIALIVALIIYPVAIVAAIVWIATGGMPPFLAGYLVWAALGCYGTMFFSTLGIEYIVRH